MKIKNNTLIWIIITFICFSISNAAVYDFNNAGFWSNSFNNWLYITTWNVAWVYVESSTTYSWDTLVSSELYNIASFVSDSFNEWLPISSWKKARVELDKMLIIWTWASISNTILYNIATIVSDSFNQWLPISSWKKARVEIDNSQWLEDWFLLVNDTYFNTATFVSDSFNEWLPISSWKKAKVVIKVPVDLYDDSIIENIDVSIDWDWTTELVDLTKSTSTWAISKIYTNSKRFIYQWKMDESSASVKILEDYDPSLAIAESKINYWNELFYWDSWLFQKIIKSARKTPNKTFSVWDTLKLSSLFLNEFVLNKEVINTDVVLPPVLTYPYKTLVWTWSEFEYNINTPFPTIKWMAKPKSILIVYVWDYDNDDYTVHYVNVDEYWLFSFDIPYNVWDKYWVDSKMDIIFQYYMLDNWENKNVYATQKLKNPIRYSVNLHTDSSFEFPYILSMYNDDEIYTDLLKIDWYWNPWTLYYSLSSLNDDNTISLIKTWDTKIWDNKRFDIFFTEESLYPIKKWKYVIEVWQDPNMKERKAFDIIWNNKENLWIFNYRDFDVIPSNKLRLIWYSNIWILNNSLLRIEMCKLEENWWLLEECDEANKEILWTVHADKNWFFDFKWLKKLKDWNTYQVDVYNSENVKIHKKIILKVDNSDSSIVNSDVFNLYSWVTLKQSSAIIEWSTLPWATVEITSWSNVTSIEANTDWLFKASIDLDTSSKEIVVVFKKWWQTYSKVITFTIDSKFKNTSNNNYFQDFMWVKKDIILK